jgi:hypothetical protein
LANQLGMSPAPGTSYYGQLFEQFIVDEAYRMNH